LRPIAPQIIEGAHDLVAKPLALGRIMRSGQCFGAAVNSVQNPAYQAGMEARFAVAARHSRMVRVLRVAVPATVVLAMAGIVVVSSVFNPFRMLLPKLPVDMDNLVVSGTKITMESPHLSGYTPDRRPYEVWAKTATQDVTDPDHLDLRTLRAKVLMEDQTTTVTLDARTGLMDTKQQLLDLHKDIFLQSSTGYEARLSQAFVDMGKGTVTSDEHVDVKLLNGTLSSDRLRITGGGEVVRFEGNVVMNLDNLGEPEQPASAPAAPEPAPVHSGKPRPSSTKTGNLR
jgi:lipopolysaccharide export system protein LptC